MKAEKVLKVNAPPGSIVPEENNMKIYFEKFGEGHYISYLTPGKLYEVYGVYGGNGGWVLIEDDEGEEIPVVPNGDGHTLSPWIVLSEET